MNKQTEKIIKDRFGDVRVFQDGFDVDRAEHSGESGVVSPIIQDKPWGAEAWLIFTDNYALKILWIEPGKRFSLQKHQEKEETWFIAEGDPLIQIGKGEMRAESGQVIHLEPGTVHRITGGEKIVEIWEVSTPELADVVRIEDDYNRK